MFPTARRAARQTSVSSAKLDIKSARVDASQLVSDVTLIINQKTMRFWYILVIFFEELPKGTSFLARVGEVSGVVCEYKVWPIFCHCNFCFVSIIMLWPWYVENIYRQTYHIRRKLLGNIIADHADVAGASPVGAAPTMSSFSTQHVASI